MNQDEKAYVLLDRLLMRGKVARLEDVKGEFALRKIFGCEEYIRLYGASITREEWDGSHWVYKWLANLLRYKRNIVGFDAVSRFIGDYGSKGIEVPIGHPIFSRSLKAARDNGLRVMGHYFVGGKWSHSRYGGGATLEFCGYELEASARYWMIEELMWMIDDTDQEWGWLDAKELWEFYGGILNIRDITFEQLDVWVRIFNANWMEKKLVDWLPVDYALTVTEDNPTTEAFIKSLAVAGRK